MNLEEFLEKETPTKEDFIKLVNPKDYDFSNDTDKAGKGATKAYKDLSIEEKITEKNNKEEEKILEKFFAYMTISKRQNFKTKYNGNDKFNNFFLRASKKAKRNIKLYGDIIDPDSNSQLLQEIYKTLWNDKILKMTEDNNKIFRGDTLNSANTTLNKLYKYIEDENQEEKATREKMKTSACVSQSISITYILSKYLIDNESKTIKKLKESKELLAFLKSYHTIGNFMPIPVDCNKPRANNIAKDYLDITLFFIYNYYINGNLKDNEIKYLMGSFNKNYEKWLDIFGKGQEGWDEFVEKNFFNDVDEKTNFVPKEGNHYGCPRELWTNHFIQVTNSHIEKSNVLPTSKDECIEYFVNAKNWISTRGELMVNVLNEKIKYEQSTEDSNA